MTYQPPKTYQKTDEEQDEDVEQIPQPHMKDYYKEDGTLDKLQYNRDYNAWKKQAVKNIKEMKRDEFEDKPWKRDVKVEDDEVLKPQIDPEYIPQQKRFTASELLGAKKNTGIHLGTEVSKQKLLVYLYNNGYLDDIQITISVSDLEYIVNALTFEK